MMPQKLGEKKKKKGVGFRDLGFRRLGFYFVTVSAMS